MWLILKRATTTSSSGKRTTIVLFILFRVAVEISILHLRWRLIMLYEKITWFKTFSSLPAKMGSSLQYIPQVAAYHLSVIQNLEKKFFLAHWSIFLVSFCSLDIQQITKKRQVYCWIDEALIAPVFVSATLLFFSFCWILHLRKWWIWLYSSFCRFMMSDLKDMKKKCWHFFINITYITSPSGRHKTIMSPKLFVFF